MFLPQPCSTQLSPLFNMLLTVVSLFRHKCRTAKTSFQQFHQPKTKVNSSSNNNSKSSGSIDNNEKHIMLSSFGKQNIKKVSVGQFRKAKLSDM